MGKLIVIEGLDCSGKETQSKLVVDRLNEIGIKAKLLSFPNYESPACGAVKLYLNGEFGDDADKINAYASSLFFTVDRLASFYKDWKKEYDETDTVFIADRYTTSNWIHQASKFKFKINRFKFVNFSKFLEFELCELPKPDTVLFLKLSFEKIKELKSKRNNKITNQEKLDIHEANDSYLKKSHDFVNEISMIEKWNEINCEDENGLRSIQDISNQILKIVKEIV